MAAGDGLVTMTPTSIAHAGAGSSASINSDGGVDFTSATSLSLNGVFTSGFDNYLIVVNQKQSTTNVEIFYMRLRAAGSDNSTASSYTYQRLSAGSTAVNSERASTNIGWLAATDGESNDGFQAHLYGPALAQPTAWRSVTIVGDAGARIYDIAGTHNQSTSYDGITFSPNAGSVTGNVVVFGYEE